MPTSASSRRLQVSEDLEHQAREWRFERGAWIVMGVLILLTLLGVFGNGPLSASTLRSSDGLLQLEYQRFARFGATQWLDLTATPADGSGTVAISVSRSFLEAVLLQRITPEPDATEVREGAVVYRFQNAPRPLRVRVIFQPARRWVQRWAVGGPDGSDLRFWTFVYP